jgi:hypothetical protein
VADLCELGNEPSRSTWNGEFIYQLQDRQLLKKDSIPPQNSSLHRLNIVTLRSRTLAVQESKGKVVPVLN